MQVTCIKVGYNSFNVLPAKAMYRAASVKSNAKFFRLVSGYCNRSSTVCRIILLLTLLLLSSGKRSIRNILFGVYKLPISTIIYFCLSTSASSRIKDTFLSRSNSRIFSSFWDANGATLARNAVSEGKSFPIARSIDVKAGWFGLCSGISAKNDWRDYIFLEVRSIELCIGFLTLRAACCNQISLVKLAFLVILHKQFLPHLTIRSQKLHRKWPAGLPLNSFGYWRHISLTFAFDNFPCEIFLSNQVFQATQFQKRHL